VPGDREVWSIVPFDPIDRARQFGRLNLASTPARIAAISTVAAVVAVAGGVAYAQASTKITLSVDGQDVALTTFEDDVASVLAAEGVTVSSRDQVAPTPSTVLHDGDTVVVNYARPLQLTVDGKKHTYWTTERTVDSALRAVGIRAEAGRLSASRSQPIGRQGVWLKLTTPKRVSVKADGRVHAVTSTAESVAALLAELRVTVDANDIVTADPDARFAAGDRIVVKRVDVRKKAVRRPVAHKVVRSSTDDLYEGESRVTRAGKDGTRRIVYRVTYVDGKAVQRTRLGSRLLVAPVTEKREVGTKSRPSSSGGSGGGSGTPAVGGGKASGLNWAALAKCESGGNPRAVNPAGYYGLYQFSVSTWRAMGGSGLPSDASSSEQTARAQTLYNRSGAGQWPNCGKYLFS
jgi:uncharacterized protein YabE (DUF348 family)